MPCNIPMDRGTTIQPLLLHTTLALGLLATAGCQGGEQTTTEGEASSGGGESSSGGGETTATPTTATPTTGGPSTTDDPTTTGGTTDVSTTDVSTTDVSATEVHMTTMIETTAPLPSCDDGIQNQDETDVDCGGDVCGPCADGANCQEGDDCEIGSCVGLVCAAPSCDDGVQNADESDVDCGGGCPDCADNLLCNAPEDCQSGVCSEGACAQATCADAVLNGLETDVDCGGDTCEPCAGGLECVADTDCLSQQCSGGVCDPVECNVDADCDSFDGACTTGKCDLMTFHCFGAPANEGDACEGNDQCVLDTVCQDGVCGGGTPKDCSALDDACHTGVCDPESGACGAEELKDGTKCEDGVACTKLEVCKAGVCGGSTDPLLVEDFSDNSAGWTLGPEWGIAPAKASVGCSNGNDPAMDHTPTDDNGLAGVNIGGCIINKAIHDYYCLTSPVIDTAAAPADVFLSYWRHLHADYTPYMKSKIEVWNGNAWVVLFETFGSPGTNDLEWKFFSYDVSSHKNANFQARWCFNVGSGGVFSVAGWSVDDVTIGANACMM
jgi:hypothetical protein